MTAHDLKTDPEVFDAVQRGDKTFEIRFNDRGFKVGDTLHLLKTVHTGAEMKAGAPLVYTCDEIVKTVSHVLTGYGLAEGWCCLSFAPEVQAPEGAQALDSLFRENEIAMSDRNGQLYDAIRAALAAQPQAAQGEHPYLRRYLDDVMSTGTPAEYVVARAVKSMLTTQAPAEGGELRAAAAKLVRAVQRDFPNTASCRANALAAADKVQMILASHAQPKGPALSDEQIARAAIQARIPDEMAARFELRSFAHAIADLAAQAPAVQHGKEQP